MKKTQKLNPVFSPKHKQYIKKATQSTISVAEGAVRAGKTIDNVAAFAYVLQSGTPDKFHLATGSTVANAKLNIGECNGFGLEHIFRGRCRWTKYKDNDALIIKVKKKEYVVIFTGGAKADSYKKFRGNSFGMWIATEINLHHENTIKEAFSRQLAAKNRKIFWDLNPDDPNSKIYKEYINTFDDRFGDRYNYQHFTIRDNATISQQRLEEIEQQYIPGTVWYRRDILGERCAAEGLVYQMFADTLQDKKYLIKSVPENIYRIHIGVDFGGNGSHHAFVATGILPGYSGVIGLMSKRINAKNTDPTFLNKEFFNFVQMVFTMYGEIHAVYCDSAEQVLIQGMRNYMLKTKFSWIAGRFHNAAKIEIKDRIRLTHVLMANNMFWYTENAQTLRDALATARWDETIVGKDVRLDNGSTDIDTLDGFEYTIERDYKRYIKRG